MATDGLEPLPCAQDIYKNGHVVFVTHTIPSNAMEKWVKKVANLSGQPVDWHFAGGRACVLAVGNLDKVNEAIQQLMPEHDALYERALGQLGIVNKHREADEDEIDNPVI